MINENETQKMKRIKQWKINSLKWKVKKEKKGKRGKERKIAEFRWKSINPFQIKFLTSHQRFSFSDPLPSGHIWVVEQNMALSCYVSHFANFSLQDFILDLDCFCAKIFKPNFLRLKFDLKTKPTKINLPNKTIQIKTILPKYFYQTKPNRPNLPYKTLQNRQNQSTKIHKPN